MAILDLVHLDLAAEEWCEEGDRDRNEQLDGTLDSIRADRAMSGVISGEGDLLMNESGRPRLEIRYAAGWTIQSCTTDVVRIISYVWIITTI